MTSRVVESYTELIPESLTKGWTLDFVLLTTFTLQQKQLTQLLYEIGAFSLIPAGRVHIYYDKSARDGNDDTDSVISEKYLHAISLKDVNGKFYSFHPKVYLLRYKKGEDCFRYIVIISSKNISTANLLDTYAVAYGDLSDKEAENGGHLSAFINNIVNLTKSEIEEDEDVNRIVADLKKVNFTQGNNNSIRFYTSKEVWNIIKNKNNLTIISPFLSEGLVNELKENIKILVSTEQGFAKLNESTMRNLHNRDQIKLFDDRTQELHAKIYHWRENDKDNYIIGSSNATNNGCGVFTKNLDGNIEYNMGFIGDENLYESLKTKIRELDWREYKIQKKKESEVFDARKYFVKFLDEHNITCIKEEKKYKVEITKKKEFESNKHEHYKIQCAIDDDFKDSQQSVGENTGWIIESKQPISVIKVKVINNEAAIDDEIENKERIFALSIYNNWNDDSSRKELDEKCIKNYIKVQEHIQKQIIEGKKHKNFSLPRMSSDHAKKSSRFYAIDKIYVHESFVKISQNVKNEEELIAALDEVEVLASNILKVDENNDKQMKIKENINKLSELNAQRRV